MPRFYKLLCVVCVFYASSCRSGVDVYGPDLFTEGKSSAISRVQIPSTHILTDKLSLANNTGQKMDAEQRFDNSSTLCTVGFCMQMWNGTLQQMSQDGILNKGIKENWQNRSSLCIDTLKSSKKGDNAWYNHQEGSLNFTYRPSSPHHCMCRSFSTVSHETGHAFLHAVIPDLDSDSEYANALHEAVGDITAIVASMRIGILNGQFPQICRKLNKGGLEMRMPNHVCIRNAADHVGYERFECHDMSKPFTKCFFEMMKRSCEEKRVKDPASFNSMLNTYRYCLLDSIFSSYSDSSNALLWNILQRFGQSIRKFGLSAHLPIIEEYRQSLTEHIDLPNHAKITIPVAINSFESDHNFSSDAPHSASVSRENIGVPPGFQSMRENAAIRRSIDSQRTSTGQIRSTYTTSNSTYGSWIR